MCSSIMPLDEKLIEISAINHDRNMASPTNPLSDWIVNSGWLIPDPAAFVRALGEKLIDLGLPVYRIRVPLRILHPQFLGITFTWQRGWDYVDEMTPPHSVLTERRYLDSPYAAIHQGAEGIRRRLDVEGAVLDFPILNELKEEGATDYIAMPLLFSNGKRNPITLVGDRPGGFTTDELALFYEALPTLARVFELHTLRRTAKTILETYLGRHAGERVLNGLIKRGDGEDIHAVIWFSDLRESTQMSETLPRRVYLDLLNDYFQCMAGSILEHEGEILSYLGDGVVAIFPIGDPCTDPEDCPRHVRACEQAIAAARSAIAGMEDINQKRATSGDSPLGFGIALHMGDVMYGNVGVEARLDFTVIGAAANEASRLETLSKKVNRPLIISREVASIVPQKMTSLGFHTLRGIHDPREVFTIAEL